MRSVKITLQQTVLLYPQKRLIPINFSGSYPAIVVTMKHSKKVLYRHVVTPSRFCPVSNSQSESFPVYFRGENKQGVFTRSWCDV
jgi:hypothetical protein